MSVKELFPKVKFGIGPAIDNGFYYDFDLQLKEEDLEKIENKMRELIKKDVPFVKKDISKKEAQKLFKDQAYKLELIEELDGEDITIYESGEFVDLCKGSHIESTKEINLKAFKLQKLAGAYWRGDEKNQMLTRIYGLAFETEDELKEYLKNLEEAEKRDHKKLGRDLDLFSFHPEAPGCAYWHPKGMIIWDCLERFGQLIRKKYGYLKIKTPQIAKNNLWITSGHWDHYREEMFIFEVEKETYCLKPMDCPFNIQIYQSAQKSYRDLPIRYTEIGHIMRNEKSGQLNGLFRIREFTQDDSHVFLREDQIESEISNLIKMIKEYYAILGVEPKFFLSTRPDDFMGEIPVWDKAEKDLKNVLSKENIDYGLKEKDGAFYGPKIDVNILDALGRSWQVATIQLDFQLPGKFGCEYVDENAERKTPVMLHAAIFGSFERMIGILIEHHAGALPFLFSPVQIRIIPVGENNISYAEELAKKLETYRVEIDRNNDTIGKKIRAGEMEKIPYLLVVGEKEITNQTVSVRQRGKIDLGEMKIEDLVKKLTTESNP